LATITKRCSNEYKYRKTRWWCWWETAITGYFSKGVKKLALSTDAKIKHGAVFNQTIASSQFICSSNRNRVQRRKGTVASTYGTWIRSSCSYDSTHSCHQYLKKQNATWIITTATARCIIQTELNQGKTHPGKKWESFPLVCKREDGNVLPEPTPNSASSISCYWILCVISVTINRRR